MAYEYAKLRHKNDPAWVRGLQPFIERATDADVKDVVRNYGSDEKATAEAAYEPREEK